MRWFTVLVAWCASGCAYCAVPAAAAAAAARDKPFYPEATHAQHFEEFKVTYHKQYATPEEERQRFEIFKNNLKNINEMNDIHTATVYAITKFSDLTTEEFVAQYTGLLVDTNSKPRSPPLLDFSSTEVPASLDWRDKNVVTSVKNQDKCNSSWAFGVIGCLESQYALKHNQLVEFSEQQLLDCDTFDYGCRSGYFENAIGYLMSNGIMKSTDYPYKGEGDKCKYDANKVAAHVKRFESYSVEFEENLKKILYNKGPIATAIDGSSLANYKSGIFQDCLKYSNDTLNHGVLLVGYGKESGLDYWLLKNSWGEDFGEKGFFKLQRKKLCLGITVGDLMWLAV